jgi:dolichol kinase
MGQAVLPTGPRVKPVKAGSSAGASRLDAAPLHSMLLDIPVLRGIAARIGVGELRRRLTHFAPVCLPFLLWGIPHQDPWGPVLVNTVLGLAGGMTAFALYRFRAIARSQQEHGLAAVVGYAAPVLLALLLLPGRAELGVMTLAIVAVGDGSATLGGLYFGGRRLPWNGRKTFTGLVSFCVGGTVMATLVYWGEARPAVPLQTAFLCAAFSTAAAAIVESLPLPWNDNFRVGATAALVGAYVQIVWLGL